MADMVLYHRLDVNTHVRFGHSELGGGLSEYLQKNRHAVQRGLEDDRQTSAAQPLPPIPFTARVCGTVEQCLCRNGSKAWFELQAVQAGDAFDVLSVVRQAFPRQAVKTCNVLKADKFRQ